MFGRFISAELFGPDLNGRQNSAVGNWAGTHGQGFGRIRSRTAPRAVRIPASASLCQAAIKSTTFYPTARNQPEPTANSSKKASVSTGMATKAQTPCLR